MVDIQKLQSRSLSKETYVLRVDRWILVHELVVWIFLERPGRWHTRRLLLSPVTQTTETLYFWIDKVSPTFNHIYWFPSGRRTRHSEPLQDSKLNNLYFTKDECDSFLYLQKHEIVSTDGPRERRSDRRDDCLVDFKNDLRLTIYDILVWVSTNLILVYSSLYVYFYVLTWSFLLVQNSNNSTLKRSFLYKFSFYLLLFLLSN